MSWLEQNVLDKHISVRTSLYSGSTVKLDATTQEEFTSTIHLTITETAEQEALPGETETDNVHAGAGLGSSSCGLSETKNDDSNKNSLRSIQGIVPVIGSKCAGKHPKLNWLVRLWVPKTTTELRRIQEENTTSHPYHSRAIRKVSIICIMLCALDISFALTIDLGWNLLPGGTALIVSIAWGFYKIVVIVIGLLQWAHFLLGEVDRCEALLQAGTEPRSSSLSVPLHISQYSRSFDDILISGLVRRDTEADVGLVAPIRRQTFPPSVA